MGDEHKKVLRVRKGELRRGKFEIFDLNGATDFLLSSGTWKMYSSKTGLEIASDVLNIDNFSHDRAGNSIKTFMFILDMKSTDLADIETGSYFIVVEVGTTAGQVDRFRVPVYVEDFESAGVS